MAHTYGKNAVKEALKMNDNKVPLLAFNTLGNIHQFKTDTDSSLFFSQKSTSLSNPYQRYFRHCR